MTHAPDGKTRFPPAVSTLIWDGNCAFCRFWITRWKNLVGAKILYRSWQDAHDQFPDIPVDNFKAALHFLEKDGTVYRGAAAVFRSLSSRNFGRILDRAYRNIRVFRLLCDRGYDAIAANRAILYIMSVSMQRVFPHLARFLSICLIALLGIWLIRIGKPRG